MRVRRARGSEAGETLVEVLVAIAILGVAGVAIMVGLMLSVKTSDIHRKETQGGADVKSWAEAIQNYVQANQSAFNCSPDYGAATVGFAPKTGYDATYTWNAVDSTGVATDCTANKAQMVNLNISSRDGRASEELTFVLRRPCSGNQLVDSSKCS